MQAPLNQTLSADGSTEWFKAGSNLIQITLDATDGNGFGSGTIKLYKKSAQGNAVPLTDDSNTDVSLTVAQVRNIEVVQGSEWRATLSGSSSPTLYVTIEDIADAPFRA